MNSHSFLGFWTLLLTLISVAAGPPAVQLEVVRNEVSGIIWRATNSPSVLVQFSEDLKLWKPAINDYSSRTNWSHGAFLEMRKGTRFYRAISQAEPVSQMLERWHALAPRAYEFTFERGCFCAEPDYYKGRVTVRNGRVVAVRDAVTLNNFPIENPDLSIFKSIEQMFAFIESVVTQKADIVLVELDEILQFPKRVEIDFGILGQDDEDRYNLTDLRALPE